MAFVPKSGPEQRIEYLIALSGERALTEAESDDLYRALHADYCRKWRAARKKADERRRKAEDARRDLNLSAPRTRRPENDFLLQRLRDEREEGVRKMFARTGA